MRRYIDANLISYEQRDRLGLGIDYRTTDKSTYEIAYKSQIDKIPTADVEKVVRCKDCKYARKVRNRNREIVIICCCFRDNPDKMDVVDYYRFMVRSDGYCYRGIEANGEREE